MLQTIILVLARTAKNKALFPPSLCRSLLSFAVKCPLLNLLIKPILNGIIKAFYLFDRREL